MSGKMMGLRPGKIRFLCQRAARNGGPGLKDFMGSSRVTNNVLRKDKVPYLRDQDVAAIGRKGS